MERGEATATTPTSCQYTRVLPFRRSDSSHRKQPTTMTALTQCMLTARSVVVLLFPPALVIVALQVSCAYVLLYLCQLVVALGGLELSWWHFRIRKRLLIPFTHEHENLSREEYDRVQSDEMNPVTCAISPLAARFLCGRNWLAAVLMSVVVCAVVVAIVLACQGSIVNVEKSTLGWRMVVGCSAFGAVAATFCACFAPTPRDGLVVVVYQTCFTVSSLNTFLAHYDQLVDDPELLDSLYVILVGACVIVVWRIVASKEVLETMITIMLDMFGLVYLVSPMMEMADFVDHPRARRYGDKICTFWIVISAAEVGHFLFVKLKVRYPALFQKCHHPLAKSVSSTYDVEDLVVSTCVGLMGILISVGAYPSHTFEVWELVVLVSAIVLSQMSRLGIDTIKAMAKVTSGYGLKSSLWNSGVMTLVSPYLVAAILFHPYIKSLFKT